MHKHNKCWYNNNKRTKFDEAIEKPIDTSQTITKVVKLK